jgi:hypothetical protein
VKVIYYFINNIYFFRHQLKTYNAIILSQIFKTQASQSIMKSTIQPITIAVREQNLYIAAGLGLLVLVVLAVISSIKKKQVSQSAINNIVAD